MTLELDVDNAYYQGRVGGEALLTKGKLDLNGPFEAGVRAVLGNTRGVYVIAQELYHGEWRRGYVDVLQVLADPAAEQRAAVLIAADNEYRPEELWFTGEGLSLGIPYYFRPRFGEARKGRLTLWQPRPGVIHGEDHCDHFDGCTSTSYVEPLTALYLKPVDGRQAP